jgi:rod shape-determining protein MreC
MDNFFTRYRNEAVLVAVLFIQVIALATQIQLPAQGSSTGGTRLIRVWAVGIISPFQKMFIYSGSSIRNAWAGYIDLRNVRQQNEQLQQQIAHLRLEQTRLEQDAAQAQRLQGLLEFKESFISKTLAAQVIGTSGTELSHVIYIDRGTADGLEAGMAVITPDGIVGKISRSDTRTSQVLLISDPMSGAGVLLERQRLNGVLKGGPRGALEIQNIMADEKIEIGDSVITTGGDRVFPKGLKVGTVAQVVPDAERDPFLAIRVKPAANLNRLEEVLVVTELIERTPAEVGAQGPIRAADMLALRLPSVKKKTLDDKADNDKKQPELSTVTGTVPLEQRKENVVPTSTARADGRQNSLAKPQSVSQPPKPESGDKQQRDEPR